MILFILACALALIAMVATERLAKQGTLVVPSYIWIALASGLAAWYLMMRF